MRLLPMVRRVDFEPVPGPFEGWHRSVLVRVALSAARSTSHLLSPLLHSPFLEALRAMETQVEQLQGEKRVRIVELAAPPMVQTFHKSRRSILRSIASWDAANAVRAAAEVADLDAEITLSMGNPANTTRIAITSAMYADWHWHCASREGILAAKRTQIERMLEVSIARNRSPTHIEHLRRSLDRIPIVKAPMLDESRNRVFEAIRNEIVPWLRAIERCP